MHSSKNVTIQCLMCKQLHKRPCNKRRSTSAVPCVSWPSQVCPFLPCHCLLVPCSMVPCLAMFACLVWSGLVLSFYAYLGLLCRVMSCLSSFALPYFALPCFTPLCLVSCCLVLSVWSCIVLSCPRLCLSKFKLSSKRGPRGSPAQTGSELAAARVRERPASRQRQAESKTPQGVVKIQAEQKGGPS
jgi:hypothetical protein